MTEDAWIRGMAELAASLPAQQAGAGPAQLRGQVYREELRHLTDEVWYFAVREAIRRERWFPTVAALLEYADEFSPETKLLGPGRSAEQRDIDREEAKKGLKAILKHCPWLTEEPVAKMPDA